MTLPTTITPGPEVELSHHRIHEGNFFSTHTISTGLLAANPKLFLFDSTPEAPFPPDTIKQHLIFIVSANPGVKIEFFEDTIIIDHGPSIPIINQNRPSTTPSVVAIFQDPIIASEGTLIFSQIVGSTTEGGTGGAIDRDEQELILKIGPHYLLKIVPLVDNTDITTHFKFYDARPSSPVPLGPGI